MGMAMILWHTIMIGMLMLMLMMIIVGSW